MTSFQFVGNVCNGNLGGNVTAYFFADGGYSPATLIANNLFIVNLTNVIPDGCIAGAGAIINNTFINNSVPQTAVAISGMWPNAAWRNNLMVGFGSWLSYAIAVSGQTSDHNIYCNPQSWGNTQWVVKGANYNSVASYASAIGETGSKAFSSINATTLVNAKTGALPSGSAAIGAGANLSAIPALKSDLAGNPRPPAGPLTWDIGAYSTWRVAGPNAGAKFTTP
jgi:hypothetical protein